MYAKLHEKPDAIFRYKLDETRGVLFNIKYQGEEGLDYGGLYRCVGRTFECLPSVWYTKRDALSSLLQCWVGNGSKRSVWLCDSQHIFVHVDPVSTCQRFDCDRKCVYTQCSPHVRPRVFHVAIRGQAHGPFDAVQEPAPV
jgi:hypothetical protein